MDVQKKWYEYRGAAHVHSSYSDGTRPVPEIAKIAEDSGLDFILINDHMTLQGRKDEGWRGSVLVLVGYEANDAKDNNHYLVYGTDTVTPENATAAQYVAHTQQQGGVGFIAHPDEQRTVATGYRGYPWTDWSVTGFEGVEIWNQMSEWVEQLTPWNKFIKLLSPRKAIIAPRKKTLARWDKLNIQRKVIGLGGTDVHAFTYRFGPFRIRVFPYKVYFKTIRTHILLTEPLERDNVEEARKAVYGALRKGTMFFTNYRRGDATGFRCYAQSSAGIANMGESLAMQHNDEVEFIITLPRVADIRLLCDGVVVATYHGKELRHTVSVAGAYRAEAGYGIKGWIYGNHIRITNRA